MGEAKSIHEVYKDGVEWFDCYVDADTYHAAFDSVRLGVKADSGMSYNVFKDWVHQNAKKYPYSIWQILLDSSPSIMMAHKIATSQVATSSNSCSKTIQYTKFRNLLVHLYACTIFWKHFTFSLKLVP